jgi:cardiolipin synthase
MAILTLANQLTLARLLLVPALVILVVYGHNGWALVTFVVAGLTDALDGLIARRAGQRTSLGALLDPMADKLLLLSTFVVLTLPGLNLTNQIPLWLTVLVISRDVIIVVTVAVVNLAVERFTFYPSVFGKIATFVYILTGSATLFFNYMEQRSAIIDVLVYASLVVTVGSGFHYILHAARAVNQS